MANKLDPLAMDVLGYLDGLGVPASSVELVLARAVRKHREIQAGIVEVLPPPLTPQEFKALSKAAAPPPERKPAAPVESLRKPDPPARKTTEPASRVHRNKPRYPDLTDRLASIVIAYPKLTLTDVFLRLEKHYGKDFMTLGYFRSQYWLPFQARKGG